MPTPSAPKKRESMILYANDSDFSTVEKAVTCAADLYTLLAITLYFIAAAKKILPAR